MTSEQGGPILTTVAFLSDTHPLAQKCAAMLRFPAYTTMATTVAQECQLASVRGGIYESAAQVARRFAGEVFCADDPPHTFEKLCGPG